MIPVNPVAGAAFHAVGALSAASCYTPQKQTRQWAWEVYWIAQASFAWLILPILGALLTVPDYFEVLANTPPEVMWRSFALGVLYGFGGLTFGLGIRYIGFSLNYAVAIGISCVLGTILPLVWTPNGGVQIALQKLVDSTPGLIVTSGIALAVVGIFLCGYAGALRERASGGQGKFSFRLGVPLAIMAGVLSSVFNFALLAGEPLAKAAVDHGATEMLSWNAIYPFSHGGAWLTNTVWCAVLMYRNRTAGQLLRLPGRPTGSLAFYYLMALLTGAMWYFQFFFYGMGHLNLGQKFGFTSWAIHMALLILFSNIYGKLFREWESASKWPRRIVHYGMMVIVAATLVITYGNYLGEQPPTPSEETDIQEQSIPPANPSLQPDEDAALRPDSGPKTKPQPGRAPMQRYGMVIGLNPEKVDEYKELHAAVWPDVLTMIRQCNIRNYSIYLRTLDDGTPYLFSYFEYTGEDFEADMARMAADPITQRWWSVCKPCQKPLDGRGKDEWWAGMEEVFHVG